MDNLRSPLKENMHPVSKLTTNKENDLKTIVSKLQETVSILQRTTYSFGIELKQALKDMSSRINKQDETIGEIKKLPQVIDGNSSRSTSPVE